MGIKQEIENHLKYKFSIGDRTIEKLAELYKRDKEYVKTFLKLAEKLRYGDEKKRRHINEKMKKKSAGKRHIIKIKKPSGKTEKYKRYQIRISY
ncbi:MAG: hypothetical protein R6U26_01210 [Candidatus Undinarchaeales archaeon]